MEEWRPPSPDRRADDLILKRKSDKLFWSAICELPDCRLSLPERSSTTPWDSLKHLRRVESAGATSEYADIDADPADACVPDDEWVRDFWRHRAIDAASVHIDSRSGCVIAVPSAARLLCDPTDDDVIRQGRTRYELTWLARLLARSTSSLFHEDREGARLEEQLQGILEDVDVLRRYAAQDFCEELLYVRAC